MFARCCHRKRERARRTRASKGEATVADPGLSAMISLRGTVTPRKKSHSSVSTLITRFTNSQHARSR